MKKHDSQPIEAVVFDIGRVLINFDFELAMQGMAKLAGLPPTEIRRRLLGRRGTGEVPHDALLAYECGKISDVEFHAVVENLVGQPLPYRTFCEIWNCIFQDEIDSTVTIMRTLKSRGGLKVGILSNTNALHYQFLRQRMPYLDEMKHVYASHEIGLRKPLAESYQHVLKQMAVSAPRTVFVDDLPENVAGAQSVGMIAIHATDSAAVSTGLKELGLI